MKTKGNNNPHKKLVWFVLGYVLSMPEVIICGVSGYVSYTHLDSIISHCVEYIKQITMFSTPAGDHILHSTTQRNINIAKIHIQKGIDKHGKSTTIYCIVSSFYIML